MNPTLRMARFRWALGSSVMSFQFPEWQSSCPPKFIDGERMRWFW